MAIYATIFLGSHRERSSGGGAGGSDAGRLVSWWLWEAGLEYARMGWAVRMGSI